MRRKCAVLTKECDSRYVALGLAMFVTIASIDLDAAHTRQSLAFSLTCDSCGLDVLFAFAPVLLRLIYAPPTLPTYSVAGRIDGVKEQCDRLDGSTPCAPDRKGV
jgi:hypothetical protein